MRLYHFLKEGFGLLDLQHRRLKIAKLNDLNDPFELLPACEDAKARQVIRDFKASADARFGMLCLSASWENPVQWSHYADGHRGMCLGFDVRDEHVEQIIYRRQRPKADMYLLFRDQPTGEREMRAWLRTKYVHWKYEREYRLFTTTNPEDRHADGLWYQDFSDDLRLAEVIVGDRSELSRQRITETLGDLAPSVRLTKARLAFRSYRVVRQRSRELWP